MAEITLRPDLKTSGGEVTELVLDGRFVGAMTLVYREGGRISGSVQLELDSLPGSRKAEAAAAAGHYIEHLMEALAAKECEVIVTCSSYDHIITAEHQLGVIESFSDAPYDDEPDDDEPDDEEADNEETDDDEPASGDEEQTRLDDIDPDGLETMEMDGLADSPIEMVIVGESRNRIEYQFYDWDRVWLCEAVARLRGADVVAAVEWKVEPTEEELEQVAELIVSDFDPDEVDTFWIEMNVGGETVEAIELTHENLLEPDDENYGENDDDGFDGFDGLEASDDEVWNYSVILVRDDGDTLTYDLYERSQGGLPIGQATVDVSSRELTGFIDFRETVSPIDSEFIGALLMRELDKEKEYETLNLTMLVNNEPIDEIWLESDMVH